MANGGACKYLFRLIRFTKHNFKLIGSYINFVSGTSILALIRTAVVTQREGFNELFANYITENPTPKIGLMESENLQCDKTLSASPQSLFSKYEPPLAEILYLWRSQFATTSILHEAACALVVTGRSERYWTAVFLDEDFYVDQPKLSVEDEDVVVGSIDPIIIKAELKATATTASPRAYALTAFALAAALREIVEHHIDIHEEFGASLAQHISSNRHDPVDGISSFDIQAWRNSFQDALELFRHGNLRLFRKVDEFLQQDVSIGSDGLPHSPLWGSVEYEPDAVSSLRSIMESRNRLREISNDLSHFIEEAELEASITAEDSTRTNLFP
ncbi:hypothetical protein NW762_010913 [Fusarium torreyae]|uniref:Uncharacterized protein n=1 Tax=Fusarium torreyae TaxID=1237075 RepID=A0A9W8RQA5_9HYPO|nr:hypothetical protein NW762_010913 [Fusarium torreyae]